jgi:hypothetical protein
MLPPQPHQHAEDIAAAAAAYLWNVLPFIMKLSAPEAFDRLKTHFEVAITAYTKGTERWELPVPSEN